MTTTSQAFEPDDDYDQQYSSEPGGSRFGAYVRDRAADLRELCHDDGFQPTERFAIAAWNIATGPVMAPGYIREHGRIISRSVQVSDWDGSLIAQVELAVTQPRHLAWLPQGDGIWRDWPSGTYSNDGFRDPDGDEVARSPYLLCSARLQFTVPSERLPAPPADAFGPAAIGIAGLRPDGLLRLVAAAREAVVVLADELSTIVDPVIARIEGS